MLRCEVLQLKWVLQLLERVYVTSKSSKTHFYLVDVTKHSQQLKHTPCLVLWQQILNSQ